MFIQRRKIIAIIILIIIIRPNRLCSGTSWRSRWRSSCTTSTPPPSSPPSRLLSTSSAPTGWPSASRSSSSSWPGGKFPPWPTPYDLIFIILIMNRWTLCSLPHQSRQFPFLASAVVLWVQVLTFSFFWGCRQKSFLIFLCTSYDICTPPHWGYLSYEWMNDCTIIERARTRGSSRAAAASLANSGAAD